MKRPHAPPEGTGLWADFLWGQGGIQVRDKAVAACAALFAIAGATGIALAQMDHPAAPGQQKAVSFTPDTLQWKDGPPSLARGAQFVVLTGDPSKEGPFAMRLRMPANFVIAPHWHPAIENVTVISGVFHIGHGETIDRASAMRMPAGSFTSMPPGMRHFAFTGDVETIVQLHGVGPWQIHYVNPADDPRRDGG
jgi:hypothetical protein